MPGLRASTILLLLMKLSELLQFLNKGLVQAGPDTEVLLCFEEGAMENGYDPVNTEGVSDIRLLEDWPLPGKSLVAYEGEKPQKLVIFYDNHYKLNSSAFRPARKEPNSHYAA